LIRIEGFTPQEPAYVEPAIRGELQGEIINYMRQFQNLTFGISSYNYTKNTGIRKQRAQIDGAFYNNSGNQFWISFLKLLFCCIFFTDIVKFIRILILNLCKFEYLK
jgi:hypothetical protein